jgi:hypothetical protein
MSGKAAKRARYFGSSRGKRHVMAGEMPPRDKHPAIDPSRSVDQAWEWLMLTGDIDQPKPNLKESR